MSIDFDFSEITDLAADIGKGIKVVPAKIAASMREVAGHIKEDWREPVSGSAYLPGGAAAITYDVDGASNLLLGQSVMSVEIGPELRGQGPLVGMLEYGTPNTGPRGYGAAALKKNEPAFEKGILKATEDML